MSQLTNTQKAKLALGLLISVVFVLWAARGLRLDEVLRALKSGNYIWLLPAACAYFLPVLLRTWRWQSLLRPILFVPIRRLMPVIVIGYMGNNVLPARAGEVLRAYVLRKNENVSITASLATIVLERVFDAIAMLLFLLVSLSFFAMNARNMWITSGLAVFCLLVLGLFWLAATRHSLLMSIYGWASRRFLPERVRGTVHGLAARFHEGLQSLRSPLAMVALLLQSACIWLAEALVYLAVAQVFPDLRVSYPQLVFMVAITALATTLPSTPGYVGTFDAPGIAVLARFGVPRSLAASFTVVLHLVLWLPITVAGWLFMAASSIRWPDAAGAMSGEAAVQPASASADSAQ